ncbi:MAG TPA: 2-C-methyl-D-erythritol 2,4-cyclodiphosphate synthase [Nitrospiria bacterium]|nr:2-C-methyl-D-erythritol 2,4-cyclodiphosphate synthase [Nitrospiria bacterium]
MRIGLGYDLHPLTGGRPLVLGGVTIPFSKGLDGHSDADVLTHAVCDALLGAAGLQDLGALYPSSDPTYRGVSSLILLEDVGRKIRTAGFRLANLDSVIVAEAPKLAPHLEQMRGALAKTLGVDPAQISIKAKRAEGVGAVGRGEGIAAQAVCLLERSNV